ncbi:hypothetical protein Avbf_09048 [Armadillidium vulgare]|nr:hypothetical protein Avbf_09048 [Armadillidium vulgare]
MCYNKLNVLMNRNLYNLKCIYKSMVPVIKFHRLTNLFKDVCNPEFTFFLCVIEFEVPSGKRLDTFPRSIKKEQIYELNGDWCNIELVEETERKICNLIIITLPICHGSEITKQHLKECYEQKLDKK